MNQIVRVTFTIGIFLMYTLTVGAQDTFSIVAMDPETGEVGSAGASCVDLSSFPGLADHFLGELFPGLGAINTQAWYNPTNQINARNRMNAGDSPDEIINWLIDNDISGQPDLRQYGIVANVNGMVESAAHTGSSTDNYKNHITGSNYSIQGNILLGQQVLDSMESRFLNADGDLACKLMAALQGANMVGADSRCTSNATSSLFAFIKVAQSEDTFGDPSFVQSVRTSDGDGIEPIDSLQTLFNAVKDCNPFTQVIEIKETNPILVYPNPSLNFLQVECNSQDVFTIEIVNTAGISIYKSQLDKAHEIDTSHFAKGVYLIRIYNAEKSYVERIIKS
ncbi:MAG: DUF1028 domain-containing protein [Saprospiraceae bacterium]|nr:DUF1028 domain-containing protein [Saprospiraceae bacterium]